MFRKETFDRFDTPNRLLAAAAELKIDPRDLRLVAADEWRAILKQVFDRFVVDYRRGLSWLWECLREDGASFDSDCALEKIGPAFDADRRVWLVLEDWARTKKHGNYWVFDCTWGAGIAALGEAIGVGEYYFVDRHFAWMLLETHHCNIVAVVLAATFKD